MMLIKLSIHQTQPESQERGSFQIDYNFIYIRCIQTVARHTVLVSPGHNCKLYTSQNFQTI